MSKLKTFCGSHSMDTYKWMSSLFCLALAIEIARLFWMMMMTIALQTLQRSRSAFELVKECHRRVERNMCLFYVCAMTGPC